MSDVALCEDLKLLLPGESAAFAFMFTEYSDLSGRPPGFPQVKWCTSMGEFSFYRGEYTYPRTTSSSSTADSSSSSSSAVQASGSAGSEALKSIRYECLSCPGELHVGDQVEIVIRVYNTTSRAMSVHLDCKAAVSTQQQSAGVGAGTSGKTGGSGSNSAMRPRLSTHSNNTTYANVLSSSSSTVAAVGASAASSGSRMMEGSSTAAGVGAQCRGLCFSGLTFTPLGIIESLDFSDLSVHVYATSAGQHVMPTLYLIDSISGDRHPIEAACSVFVHDSDEWIDEEEEKVEERVHEVALSSKGLAETKSEPPNAKVKPAAILAPSGAVRPPIPAPTPAPLPPMPATAPVAVPVPVQTAEEQEEKISVEVKVADQAAAIIDTDLIAESAPAEMTFTSAQQLPLVPSACSMESLDLTSSLAQFLEESAKEIEQEFGTATPSPNGPQMGVCDADGIDIDMV